MKSKAFLSQSKYAHYTSLLRPSNAVLRMEEEVRIGIPPVGPAKGEDFVKWLVQGECVHRCRCWWPHAQPGGSQLAGIAQASSKREKRGKKPIALHAFPSLVRVALVSQTPSGWRRGPAP